MQISHQGAPQRFEVATKLETQRSCQCRVARQDLDHAAGPAGYVHENFGELADAGRVAAAFVLEIDQLVRAPVWQPSASGARGGFTHRALLA
jgi:hypothetical protein